MQNKGFVLFAVAKDVSHHETWIHIVDDKCKVMWGPWDICSTLFINGFLVCKRKLLLILPATTQPHLTCLGLNNIKKWWSRMFQSFLVGCRGRKTLTCIGSLPNKVGSHPHRIHGFFVIPLYYNLAKSWCSLIFRCEWSTTWYFHWCIMNIGPGVGNEAFGQPWVHPNLSCHCCQQTWIYISWL